MREDRPLDGFHDHAAPEHWDGSETRTTDGAATVGGFKLFVIGFVIMLVLGGTAYSLKSATQSETFSAVNDALDSLRSGASKIAEIPGMRWFKDRTIYWTVDDDGLPRLATDEEVTEHKAFEQALKNDVEHNRELLEQLSDGMN